MQPIKDTHVNPNIPNIPNIRDKVKNFNTPTCTAKIFNITYSHIKDTTGIRYGVNIRLVVLTGARNMRPEGGGAAPIVQTWKPSHEFYPVAG